MRWKKRYQDQATLPINGLHSYCDALAISVRIPITAQRIPQPEPADQPLIALILVALTLITLKTFWRTTALRDERRAGMSGLKGKANAE